MWRDLWESGVGVDLEDSHKSSVDDHWEDYIPHVHWNGGWVVALDVELHLDIPERVNYIIFPF